MDVDTDQEMESRQNSLSQNPPTLIRKYLDKDIMTVGTTKVSTIVKEDYSEKVSSSMPTIRITPFNPVAVKEWNEESKLSDDLSSIDSDALSTSGTFVDDETSNPEVILGTLKSLQNQDQVSLAQEACSKITEQCIARHTLKHFIEDIASQARFFILGSKNNDPAIAVSTSADVSAKASTASNNPKYQQHVRISSIESFPSPTFSESKSQHLSDLFRLANGQYPKANDRG
ncbi:hypothetical protein BGZ46_008639, partial [Entomortierella lignicola]